MLTTATAAFGIAASRSMGLRANYGTMTKSLQAGEAARVGVIAAQLAQRGFTASPIEAPDGWAQAITGTEIDASKLLDGLGEQPLALEAGIHAKMFPSCAATHGVLDALGTIALDQSLADVRHVRVRISGAVLRESLSSTWPSDGLQARFSLDFCIALMLDRGRVELADFTPERIEAVSSLRPLIDVIAVDGGREVTTTVEVETAEHGSFVRDCRSATDIEITPGQLRDKFIANVTTVGWGPKALSVLERIDGLRTAADVSGLARLTRWRAGLIELARSGATATRADRDRRDLAANR